MKQLRRNIVQVLSNFAVLLLVVAFAVPQGALASVTSQTWTIRQSATHLPTTASTWQSITWGSTVGLFAAVANDATGNTVMTSPDGINWTRRTPASNATWDSIDFSPSLGIYAAVAFNGAKMWSTDGITWTLGTGAGTDLWTSVVWSSTLSKFVAVSNSGTVMYSTDGKAWSSTGVTGVGAFLWASVTWSPDMNKFVAISNTTGTANELMTSPDGLTWTMQTSAASVNWVSVTSATSSTAVAAAVTAGGGGCTLSNTGLVVALGNGAATIEYSCDGTTWTSPTLPSSVAAYTFRQVAFGSTAPNGSGGSGLFMAVANSGLNMSSPDGIHWTDNSAVEPYTVNMKSLVWNPTGTDPQTGSTGFFAIVCTSGAAAIVTTHDGLTNWGNYQTTGYSWQSQAWSPSLSRIVAVTNTGGFNRIMYSSDAGVTWTAANVPVSVILGTPGLPGNWRAITWSADLGIYLAVGANGTGNRVMTSPDGITWTLRSSAGDFNWDSVVYAHSTTLASGIGCTAGTQGIFVAGATSTGTTTRIEKSCDGITWTTSTTPNQNIQSIAWGPTAGPGGAGQFAAVGTTAGTGAEIMYSSDAITWTTATSSASSSWNSVAWSPEVNRFVAVSTTSGTTNIMYSPLGTAAGTWTGATSPITAVLNSVAWSPQYGIFTAVGNTGAVLTSPNATTWTSRTAAAANNWFNVIWAPELGKFISVSNTGTTGDQVMTSDYFGPPTISSISSTPDYNSATVTWSTDIESSSQVIYSTDTSYSSSTTLDSTQVNSHSVSVTGLLCSQLYHYKVVSTYLTDTVQSADNTFTTTACDTPTLTVQAATSVTATSATLNGTITATRGTSARNRGFNYGLTASYGSSTSEAGLFDTGAYSLSISGLSCSTTYHYQAFAINLTGTGASTDATFTTGACSAPTVTVQAASSVTGSAVTLNGTITDTGGQTVTVRGFNYGPTISYGTTTTESGSFSTGAFTASIASLTCGTTYHVQAYATNATGTATSSDTTFTTNVCSAPTVTVSAASALTASSATLNGTVTATGGQTVTVRGFNYGPTISYGTTTTESGSFSTGAFTADIASLTCGTTYHYQAYATNASGTGTSVDGTFSSSACPVVASSGSNSNIFYVTHSAGRGGAPLDFTINGGSTTTTLRTVRIAMNADPNTVSGYAISLDPTFASGVIITYAPTASFTLPGTPGTYTLYLKYYSTSGIATPAIAHSITYAAAGAPSNSAAFTRALDLGSRGADVRMLQIFLNAHGAVIAVTGPGSVGNETTFFGLATKKAVAAFQELYAKDILTPNGLTKGTGKFGISTRTFVNSLILAGK